MKVRLFIIFSMIISFASSSVFANTSPFQALRYIGSARATAMASCFVAMTDDPAAIFFNPATIYTNQSKNFSTTFFKHVLDINSGQISYVVPEKKAWASDGVIATGISYTNFGSFEYADKNGNRNGTFSANDVSALVSYANELDSNFYYGVSAKMMFINLENASSIAFAMDAGLLYTIPDKKTNIGLSILHVGGQVKTLGDVSESLPLDVRLGVSHRLEGLPLLISFSFHHLADETDKFLDKFMNFALGGEFYLGDYIQVRLGYDRQIRQYSAPSINRKLAGFTGGIGLKTKTFNFDYGMAQEGNGSLLHRFSIWFNL